MEFRPEPQDGFTSVDREVYHAINDEVFPDWLDDPTELADDDDSAYWYGMSETDTDVDPVDLYGADYGDDQPEWMQ